MNRDDFLNRQLDERRSDNALRKLVIRDNMVDFSSNDYLGIKHQRMLQPFFSGRESHGSAGSRLLSGNYKFIEETEQFISGFHRAETSLIFNSGYAANVGIVSSVPRRGDSIFFDQLCHASLRDGIRLSFADAFSFQHNDLNDLERKLMLRKGNTFVVTESVFSMDGDLAPIADLVTLCEKYNAHLIVDEAHATGVIGEKGEGLVQHLRLEDKVFARVFTFGKALGCHGAAIVGSENLKIFLINFARPFIYTTALPEIAVRAILSSYQIFPEMHEERKILARHIVRLQNSGLQFERLNSQTPIQGLIFPGNRAVRKASQKLQEQNFDVRPILHPTVPKNRERLRINLHAFNTSEEIDNLIRTIRAF